MSKKAYLLIESEPGSTSQLISDLASVKEVVAVEFVSGPYDFIAEIEVEECAAPKGSYSLSVRFVNPEIPPPWRNVDIFFRRPVIIL